MKLVNSTMFSFTADPASCGGLLFAVYYQQEKVNILGDTSAFPYCAFHGIAESELITFAGNVGLELCRLSSSLIPVTDTVKVTGWTGGAVLLIGSFGFLVYKLYSCFNTRNAGTPTSKSSTPGRTPASRRRRPRRQWDKRQASLDGENEEHLVAIIDVSDDSGDEVLQPEYFGPLPPTPTSDDEAVSPLLHIRKFAFGVDPLIPRCFSTPAGFTVGEGERGEADGLTASQLVQFDEGLWLNRASSAEFWTVRPDDGIIQVQSPDGAESRSRSRSRSQSLCENQSVRILKLKRQKALTDSFDVYRMESCESIPSDLESMMGSIDFSEKDNVGFTTMKYFDRLEAEVNNLREKCLEMDQEIEDLADDEDENIPEPRIPSNVSSWSLSSFSSDLDERLTKESTFKGILSMTTVGASIMTDSDSAESSMVIISPINESMEWDSPVHGWSAVPATQFLEASQIMESETESKPSTAKTDATSDDTEVSWEWDNDGLDLGSRTDEEDLDSTIVPTQVSIEIEAFESEMECKSRASTKSPSPVTVRSMSRSKSPFDHSDQSTVLSVPVGSPRRPQYLVPLARSGSQPAVNSQILVKSPKKWLSAEDSVEMSDVDSEHGSTGISILTPISERSGCHEESKHLSIPKTSTYDSLMSTGETPVGSLPSSVRSPGPGLLEGDRDSAYDGLFDVIADISQDAVGSKVDIMAYADAVWQGQTNRAKTMKKGFAEVVIRTGCTQMRRLRGDSYSLLRATLFAALNSRHRLPSSTETLQILKETLHKRGQTWLLDWSFGNRLPYGQDNVEEGWRECLNCLENLAIDLDHETDVGSTLVHSLSVDCEMDIRLVEAAKLHILASMLEPYTLDPNGNYASTRSYIEQNLDTVGDTRHLSEKDLHLVARALRLNLCLLKPCAYGSDNFCLLASAGSSDSVVTLIAEDDRYYCVPVL